MFAFMMRYGTEAAKEGFDEKLWRSHSMMWGQSGTFFWVHSVLALVTWALLAIILIALARWLWFKGDQEKKNRK